MFKWILLIFLIVYVVLSRIYPPSPYKMYMYFGKPGSGKTLAMCKIILKYIKKGWVVYTDIPGINIPGVRKFDAKSLSDFCPCEKSLIVVDEAGILWSNRDFKNFNKGLVEFFKTYRHYKCTIIMNSQNFDIDKKIRDLCSQLFLVKNIGSLFSLIRPIKRSITLTEATSEGESRIADNLKFEWIFSWRLTYMPRYFKYFDSYFVSDRPEIIYECVGDDQEVI